MNIKLLEYVCDYTGKSDINFMNYVNDKNIIPQSIIYILLYRGAYELVELCAKYGFLPDKDCVNFACLLCDANMLKLCCKYNTISKDNMEDILSFCCDNIGKYINNSKEPFNVNYDTLCNAQSVRDMIYEKINNPNIKYYNCKNELRDIYGTRSFLNGRFYSTFKKYDDNFISILFSIDSISFYRNKTTCNYNKKKVIECINCAIENNYVMTNDNWNTFINLELNAGLIKSNTILYTQLLCSSSNNDIIKIIKKSKLSVDEQCLINAIERDNVDLVEYILQTYDNISVIQTNTIEKAFTLAFIKQNINIVNIINKKYNVKPNKKSIETFMKDNVILSYLLNENLISCTAKNDIGEIKCNNNIKKNNKKKQIKK
jgi:hypothetical protein